jgi:hypothetical protein
MEAIQTRAVVLFSSTTHSLPLHTLSLFLRPTMASNDNNKHK